MKDVASTEFREYMHVVKVTRYTQKYAVAGNNCLASCGINYPNP